ncbi:MAG TPA: ATP-binding protein [Verrucomicrobiae bacterium]|jgi:PAS domain S-box-containing protein
MNAMGRKNSVSDAGALETNYGALLDCLPDAVVIIDTEGCIVLANARAEELFGYARGELLRQPVDALFPARIQNSHAGNGERSGLRKNGSKFPIEIHFSPLQTEAGARSVAAIRDISARKQIEAELKEKSAALEAAGQELQAFSYSVSHDLRAPLRAMGGFAAILKKSLGPDVPKAADDALIRIQDNVKKMSRLIEGLLDFSGLTWVAVTRKSVNPGELAQNVFNELAHAASGDRRVDCEISQMPGCTADIALLRRVFTNLLSNALKFTRGRDPAVILVGCRDQNGERVYFVRDNGAGFDMEYSDKLFRVFQRLHSPSEFEGTGVGLAIAHRIILRHGGRIWAEGEVDRGATFYFTLGESTHGNSAKCNHC